MAILKLFLELASNLQESPSVATGGELDSMFATSAAFAYIGNRKGLKELVVDWMRHVRANILEFSAEEESLLQSYSDFAATVNRLRAKAAVGTDNPAALLETLFGSNWQKNSGAYPDFILASENSSRIGDGAILELKDSKGLQIASFNSTIPTRFKSLREIQHITKSKMPVTCASLYDLPSSLQPDYLDRQRSCFYFIRTDSKNPSAVRLSLVEGSFFETVPKNVLLKAVWSQILARTSLTEQQRDELVEPLSRLEQGDIAKSRSIEKASIKPRFRIMAEAHSEGNPHRYAEIDARTLNLILKLPESQNEEWAKTLFAAEGAEPIREIEKDNVLFLRIGYKGQQFDLEVFTIRHKRNGDHLVIQFALPLSGKADKILIGKKPRKMRESTALFELDEN